MRTRSPFKTEADFIEWIAKRTPQLAKGLTLGIGDDAALVRVPSGQELILKADMTIEGVHFKSGVHPALAVGHRALARSLSDIAAMGGTPRFALISIALSQATNHAWLKNFYRGLTTLGSRFGVAIIGGDTAVTAGPTTVDVIVTGEVPRGQGLRRSGAKVGDGIFVSGSLGMSALGLRLQTSRQRVSSVLRKTASRAHLFPEPQCALGRFLASHRLANAMMDLSDGLSIDLQRLCKASGVGAKLFADRIPTPTLADKEVALKLALHGGEDYQLLFTVSARKAESLPTHFGKIPLHCVGEIQQSKSITLITRDGRSRTVKPQGWDHFARFKAKP